MFAKIRLSVLSMLFLLGSSAMLLAKESVNPDKTQEDLLTARRLFQAGKYEEGLQIVQRHQNEMKALDAKGIEWLNLFIKGSEELGNTSELRLAFEFFPELFKQHEEASLLVADAYLFDNQLKNYKKVRNLWKDRETKHASWLILDADELLLEGKRRQAIQLLNSQAFDEKTEAIRLLRLAEIHQHESPAKAWDALVQASRKFPQDPDIKVYKAKFLEDLRPKSAEREFEEALRIDPDNVYIKEQIANFYIKQGDYDIAMQFLKNNLSPPSSAELWMQALFFGKVAMPISSNIERLAIPKDDLDSLISYLEQLPKGVFWNELDFSKLPDREAFLKIRPELFWLKVLDHLKNQREQQALHLMTYSPFAVSSWAPDVIRCLKQIVNYRLHGSLKIEAPFSAIENRKGRLKVPDELLQFCSQVNRLAESNAEELSPEWNSILTNQEIFSVIFASMKWFESAIFLRHGEFISSDFPAWAVYRLLEAVQKNQGLQEALQLIDKQNEWQASFKESLAREASLHDNDALAEQLYQIVGSNSSEAKSYFAKKAFLQRDLTKARMLTEELIKDHPNDQVLQNNLKKIESLENQSIGS